MKSEKLNKKIFEVLILQRGLILTQNWILYSMERSINISRSQIRIKRKIYSIKFK